jgi:hypothetical protein
MLKAFMIGAGFGAAFVAIGALLVYIAQGLP